MSSRGPVTPARFLPGVVIADRWRVVARLGEGGMGEVYRADDLKLNEPVALKFLPQHLEDDAGLRDRFLAEAKLARRVAHPNVCRVFDLGEAGGRPFLSMEYVDGEDVATLLSRIGRLPPDKAVQIAREICAGLAAAHAQGILHRDLKPSNVMLDGRGHARLTDFGLATFARGALTEDAFAGTPAYMAPEQFEGKAPSRATDVYALGLVLYEIFTGRRVFAAASWAEHSRLRQTTTPSQPSLVAPGIEPAVERVILRCLAVNPSERPPGAEAVAAALPGGDPLAAALAAGETPSPELVAAGVGDDAMAPRALWGGLAAFGVLIALLLYWVPARQLLSRAPLQRPPAVLVDRARTICDSLGWTNRRDEYAVLKYSAGITRGLVRQLELTDVSQVRPESFQQAFGLSYWASSGMLRPISPLAWSPTFSDPPLRQGSLQLQMSGDGRPQDFRGVVDPYDSTLGVGAPDTAAALRAFGLAESWLRAVEPGYVPQDFADRRAAWTTEWRDAGEQASLELRVELAWFRDRVSSFTVFPAQALRERVGGRAAPPPHPVPRALGWWAGSALLVGAFVVGWRHLRRGQADARGALRVTLAMVVLEAVSGILVSHRGDGLATVPNWMWTALMSSALPFAFSWPLYLTFEPVLRRTWPHLMVSWMRLMDGRWRDPRLAADVLLGLGGGCALFVAGYGLQAAWSAASHTFVMPGLLDDPGGATDTLMGGGYPFAQIAASLQQAMLRLFWFAGLLALVTTAVRRRRLAVGIAIALFVPMSMAAGPMESASDMLVAPLLLVAWVMLSLRLGLVGGLASMFAFGLLRVFPLVTPGASWYWPVTAIGVGSLVLLALAAFRIALAGARSEPGGDTSGTSARTRPVPPPPAPSAATAAPVGADTPTELAGSPITGRSGAAPRTR